MAIKSKINFIFDKVILPEVFEGKYKEIINNLNQKIALKEVAGQKNLGFFEADKCIQKNDYLKIKNIVKFFWNEKIDALVVIAPKHICMQSEGIINLANSSAKKNKKIEIIFFDESYDGIDVAKLIQYLENRSFAINIISQNGEDFESLIIFRELISLLNNQVGRNNAIKYIFVTTNNNYGKLFNLVQMRKYHHLVLLDNTTERFLNYSAAVLLPMACANIDIDEYIEGAKEANEFYSNTSLENNPAYKYALVRYIFNKQTKNRDEKDIFSLENIVVGSKTYKAFADLFSMYLNSTSYRSYRGICVNSYIQPSDTKANSNLFFNKQRKMFDTHLIIKNPLYDFNIAITSDIEGDDLSFLMKQTYNKINKLLNQVVKDYHLINQIPFLEIVIEDLEDKTLGWLIAFIHRAAIMSSYLMKLNPFEDFGLKTYNIEMNKKITDLIGGNKND